MKSKFRIYQYGPSKSAHQLRRMLNGLRIRRTGSRYRYRNSHTVINWGSSNLPLVLRNIPILNQPEAIGNASSKTRTFSLLKRAGVQIPDWTTDREIAKAWLQEGKILGRNLDRGSQGRGITLYKKGEEPGNHLFYVRYSKKQREFRVHVMNNTVIFVQEKLKKRGVENANKYIRSHNRGWCFAFGHLADRPEPEDCRRIALLAVRALGLDFGAVDLGWNDRDGATVFEVNTAPGLENSSLKAYAEAFNVLG